MPNSCYEFIMCFSNRANQHAHFPGRAVSYAASIRRALNYDLSRYTIPSEKFRLSANASIKTVARFVRAGASTGPPRLRRCGGCGGCCCHFCGGRFFVLFRCLSCDEAISLEELSWSISKPPGRRGRRGPLALWLISAMDARGHYR